MFRVHLWQIICKFKSISVGSEASALQIQDEVREKGGPCCSREGDSGVSYGVGFSGWNGVYLICL